MTSPEEPFPPLSAETEWEDELIQTGLITDVETGEPASECDFGGGEEAEGLTTSGALSAEDVRCLICGGAAAAAAGEGGE